jgi:hypothetical protein
MSSFWLQFIISEAISVAEAFVSLSTLPVGVKSALENFISAGQALVTALQLGK